MRCTKCGNELRQTDAYCSNCGQKVNTASAAPEKKNGGCLFLVLIIAAIIFISNKQGGNTSKPEPEAMNPPTQSISLMNHTLPGEPYDGDVLEDSDYPDGMPRRRVSDYGDKYITDYRPDGTMLRDVILYYSEGVYSAKRVTNYDDHGNPTDTTERMADGTLWMYLYYENAYTDDGRPFCLTEYNRAGYLLREDIYMYNDDGTYSISWTEFRGPVYEYDFETNPTGETEMFSYGYVTFDADGNVIDQMIEEVPVSDR